MLDVEETRVGVSLVLTRFLLNNGDCIADGGAFLKVVGEKALAWLVDARQIDATSAAAAASLEHVMVNGEREEDEPSCNLRPRTGREATWQTCSTGSGVDTYIHKISQARFRQKMMKE